MSNHIDDVMDELWAGDRRVSVQLGDRLMTGRVIAIRSRHEIVEGYYMDVALDNSDHVATVGIGPLI